MTSTAHVQSPLMNVERGSGQPRSRLWTLLAVIVGGVFIYAGVLKTLDPVKFARDIQNFHLLPWAVGVRLAFYLPWLEILCGAALIVRFCRYGALAILSALMLVFIAATVSARVRGINLDCGCFGTATKNMTFTSHLLIDFALLGGLLALWILPAEGRRNRR